MHLKIAVTQHGEGIVQPSEHSNVIRTESTGLVIFLARLGRGEGWLQTRPCGAGATQGVGDV